MLTSASTHRAVPTHVDAPLPALQSLWVLPRSSGARDSSTAGTTAAASTSAPEGRRAGVGPELAEAEVGDAEHRRRLEGPQRRHASESRHGVLLGEPARRPTASQPGSA